MELDNSSSPTYSSYSSSSPPTFTLSSPTYSFSADSKTGVRPNVIVKTKSKLRQNIDDWNIALHLITTPIMLIIIKIS